MVESNISHWLQGDMFDSTMNYDFRKHCGLFFAQGSVDAEDFAGRVADMLMRYRLQMVPAQLNLLDSHDVGRFLSQCGGDPGKYRLAVLFQMSFVGMPTVFYGDELGIEGVLEEEYRKPMPWEGGDSALRDFFRRAIAMRRELPPLRRGNFRILSAEPGSRFLAFSRTFQGQSVTVCLNAGGTPVELPQRGKRIYWAEKWSEGRLAPWGFAVFVD